MHEVVYRLHLCVPMKYSSSLHSVGGNQGVTKNQSKYERKELGFVVDMVQRLMTVVDRLILCVPVRYDNNLHSAGGNQECQRIRVWKKGVGLVIDTKG